MTKPPDVSHKFGRYLLTVADREIRIYSDGNLQAVPPPYARALRLLVERQGLLVSKQELFVEMAVSGGIENTVTKAIHELRNFLNDTSTEPRFIQTERGTGYRFIHPLGPSADAQEGGRGELSLTQEMIAELAAGAPRDGMETFKVWTFGPGWLLTFSLLTCIVLTVGLSVVGTYLDWEWNKLAVSLAQASVLTVVIIYQIRTIQTRTIKEFVEVDVNDPRQRAVIIVSADCNNLDEWNDASYIATESLKRYTVYWRGIFFAWLLLYVCLAGQAHPSLNFNCPIDSTQYCVGGFDNLESLVKELQAKESQPLTQYLREHLSAETLREIDGYVGPGPRTKTLQRKLAYDFNALLKDPYLPRLARELDEESQRRVAEKHADGLAAENRLLLDIYYPKNLLAVPAGNEGYYLSLAITLCNNFSSLMIFLCFSVLNNPKVIKKDDSSFGDGAFIAGAAVVVMITVVLAFLLAPPGATDNYYLLKWWSWTSGIAGGIVMALYVGRLQSKFSGPSPVLLLALYSYTAIQSLFIFLEERQTAAIVLINLALALKCLLFLYMAWLFRSGRLLFYLVRVRRAYLDVTTEWLIFRYLIKRRD
jgi:DNA-binding winged helix-turn-helix (wHTH) protein